MNPEIQSLRHTPICESKYDLNRDDRLFKGTMGELPP